MRRNVSELIAVLLAVGITGSGLGLVPPAAARTVPCVEYTSREHWLPNPHGTSSTPSKVADWQGMLVTLRPEGLELTNLDNPSIPAAARRIVGSFSDFALGPDYIVLGSAGRLQGFNLPELSPRFDFLENFANSPRLACSDTLVVAAFGSQLNLYSNVDPATLAPLGTYNVPQYNPLFGLGALQVAGDHLLSCAGGGNSLFGYGGALTVIDIADPASPILTDRTTFAPGDPDSASTMFFEAQPHGPGFVVSGLIITGNLRPDVTNSNRQFLARITIEGGRIAWHGMAEVTGAMTSGFTIDGNRALWSIGPPNAGEGGFCHLVNLDWNLPNPTYTVADHHFQGGRMCWIPEHATLSSGRHLYHLEELRSISIGSGYNLPGVEDRNVRIVDDFTAVAWKESRFQMDRYLWSHDFSITAYSLAGATPIATGGFQTQYGIYNNHFIVTGCAVMGPHVYFGFTQMPDAPGTANYRVDIRPDGTVTDPIITSNETIRCAIPWDDRFVMATSDSLEICTVNSEGEITTSSALRHVSAFGTDLVRAGNLLLVKSATTPTATVSVFDLSDLAAPRFVSSSTGWNSYLAYVPEAGLLFDFGAGELRWQTIAGTGVRTVIGSWATPFPGTIYDLCLRDNTLYLALGGCGLGVYEFDPLQGLTPAGGDLGAGTYFGLAPARILPLQDGNLLVSPHVQIVGPDCNDPLPVFASGFDARRLADGVRLTWQCAGADTGDGMFEVWREQSGSEQFVGHRPAIPGHHELVDSGAGDRDPCLYNLYLLSSDDSRLLLDSISLPAGPVPGDMLTPTAAPNPFNAGTTISFDLVGAVKARVSVHDVAGHLVRTLVDGTLEQGRQSVAWSGRDERGRAVSSGVYFARIELPDRTWIVRLGFVK